MRIGKHLLIALAIVTCTGCMTVGRKIDTDAVNRFQIGKTTRREVIAAIGSPDQVSRNGNDTTYMYMYARSEVKAESFIPYVGPFVGGTKSQNQSVMVTFGQNDIVKDINSTMGGMETSDNLATGDKARLTETEDNKRAK